MDGKTFIKNLRKLEVPLAEDISPSDYDWIFLKAENKVFSQFWQSFFENVTLDNILKKEEISEYKTILSEGSTQSLATLEKLAHVSQENHTYSLNSCNNDDQDESDKILQEIYIVQQKRQNVRLQTMKLQESIRKKEDFLKSLQLKLQNTDDDLQNLSHQHESVSLDLSSTVRNAADNLFNYSLFPEFSLEQWQAEEMKHSLALQSYINKQFSDDIPEFSSGSDSTDFSFNFGIANLQLIRGPKQMEYKRNMKDLNRIMEMLEDSSFELISANIENARQVAKFEEAIKILKLLKSETPKSIQLQLEEKDESISSALQDDIHNQMELLKQKSNEMCQWERSNTLAFSYDMKLQRQGYFLQNQKQVIDYFTRKISRYDFFQIVFDTKKKQMKEILDVLHKMDQLLSSKQQQQQRRMHHIVNVLHESWKKKNLPIPLEEHLKPNELDSIDRTETNEDVASLERRCATLKDSQMMIIRKMSKICSILKNCSVKGSGSQINPWMDPQTAERDEAFQQRFWDFKQQMLSSMKKFSA